APTGDAAVQAMFNAAGQLTGTTATGAGAGTSSYSYDAAGNRSAVSADGVTTQFAHDPAGRLTGTSTEGRSTSYAYDGLDRQVATTDSTGYGTDTTTQTWDGLAPVFTDSALHGGTDLFRDPFGEVAVQDGPYGAEWLLGDRRNTTATTDTAGQITDLVDYSDFGGARYQSTGWSSYVGNDGQPGDATLGVDQYYARSYDPQGGSWLEPDDWRGLLVQPQTLNRYAYVTNNPATYSDLLGYRHMLPDRGRAGKYVPKAVTAAALDRKDQILKLNKVNANRAGLGQYPVATLATTDGRRGGPKPKAGVNVPSWRSPNHTSVQHPSYVTGNSSGPSSMSYAANGCGSSYNPCGAGKVTPEQQAMSRAALHAVLTALGLVPVFGEAFDGIDALVSLSEGDSAGAALSAAAIIPGAGWAAAGTKFVKIGSDFADATKVADVLPTPQVGSEKLQNYVNNLYKGTDNPNRVGDGTTMDAVRNEIATGLPTAGRFHLMKAQETLNGLNKWLRQNPDAAHSDRLVAQSLADELKRALEGAQ
ncbi:MAG: hypothetical protein M3Y23_06450, partial [Actinomycetota bacterium]|nr:hypothetical protein [Actinomycetota bacterium]